MVKKIISYIFIYILLVGCESPLVCEDCYLDIKAPNLTLDNNGYYHMEFLGSYVQTFSTLEAETGITSYNQKVKWVSNKEILIAGHWTNLVMVLRIQMMMEKHTPYLVFGKILLVIP